MFSFWNYLRKIPALLCVSAALLPALALAVTASDAPSFNPQQTFAPYAYPQPASALRSASGVPGPLFWQNHADYQIKATLDPTERKLSGSEIISYINHSLDDLNVLWLQAEQNR